MTTAIDSAAAFRAAINDLVRQGVVRQARHIWFVDTDFQDWPLDEPEFIDALTAFVRLPGRRVLLLGRQFDIVARTCPRLVAWRRVWGHTMDVMRPVDDETNLPTLAIADTGLAVQLLDRVHWRGRLLDGDPRVHVMAQEVDAFVQRAEPAFGSTTLGL
jgi:hypothetical protein